MPQDRDESTETVVLNFLVAAEKKQKKAHIDYLKETWKARVAPQGFFSLEAEFVSGRLILEELTQEEIDSLLEILNESGRFEKTITQERLEAWNSHAWALRSMRTQWIEAVESCFPPLDAEQMYRRGLVWYLSYNQAEERLDEVTYRNLMRRDGYDAKQIAYYKELQDEVEQKLRKERMKKRTAILNHTGDFLEDMKKGPDWV